MMNMTTFSKIKLILFADSPLNPPQVTAALKKYPKNPKTISYGNSDAENEKSIVGFTAVGTNTACTKLGRAPQPPTHAGFVIEETMQQRDPPINWGNLCEPFLMSSTLFLSLSEMMKAELWAYQKLPDGPAT